ncbi:MAG: PTS lactose/cellobiose transporter subunit IIA [Bacillota bacterium]
MTEEELQTMIFEIITHGGDAKGYAYDALKAAEEEDFKASDEYMQKANDAMHKAHNIQTKMIQFEAQGQKTPMSVLLVHSQDHLMTAMEAKTLIEGMIRMHKKIVKLKSTD